MADSTILNLDLQTTGANAGTWGSKTNDNLEKIENAKRDDGTPVFTLPTAASLLVFFVLAMQCLPTIVVTKRETGSWNWSLLQLGYMTILAWGTSFITYTIVSMVM